MQGISEELGDGCEAQAQQAEPRQEAFGEKLGAVIASLPADRVTLVEIRDLVGQDGLLLLTAFLTLVFMVPVSIPGVSTVFGGAILLVGLCRLLGRNLWLPSFIKQRALPAENVRVALVKGGKWLHRLERVSRPRRLSWMVSAGLMNGLSNGAIILGAILLMAPFGLIPFSNTLPALALLLLSVGLLQSDGLFILFGHLVNLASIAYFSVLLLGGGVALKEIWQKLF